MTELVDRRTLLVGGVLLLADCDRRGSGEAVRRLRVSVVGKGDGDTQVLLRTAGIATPGFRVDYVNFESGHLVVEAFNGHALDYGGM